MTAIAFQQVTKHFPGARGAAVDDVSFEAPEAGICMLLGTSGSGKTTLLRMVNRLSDPSSGQVLIDGVPTVEHDPIALRRGIGYVIQQVGLFPHLNIADNVRVVPSITGRSRRETAGRVDELLMLVGLPPDDYRDRYPRQLSGGEQQRVGLARALAADPDVLLMDEPFGALDAITRERMQSALAGIQREMRKTILFVTHDVGEAFRLGDRIAVLSGGRLMQVGTPLELLARPANDFVSDLVGSANVVRQAEYLPVTAALESRQMISGDHERIPADTSLLNALLHLIRSGQPALSVDDVDGGALGIVTVRSIAARLDGERDDALAVGAGPAALARMSHAPREAACD